MAEDSNEHLGSSDCSSDGFPVCGDFLVRENKVLQENRHAKNAFDDKLRSAVMANLGGVAAISPERYAAALQDIADSVGCVMNQNFRAKVAAILKDMPCLIEQVRRTRCYAVIDLVITKDDQDQYHATGGPREALFCGSGRSSDEAIGAWFRQNREAVNFQVSFVVDNSFQSSTKYGVGRSKDQLGPNELKALENFERAKPA